MPDTFLFFTPTRCSTAVQLRFEAARSQRACTACNCTVSAQQVLLQVTPSEFQWAMRQSSRSLCALPSAQADSCHASAAAAISCRPADKDHTYIHPYPRGLHSQWLASTLLQASPIASHTAAGASRGCKQGVHTAQQEEWHFREPVGCDFECSNSNLVGFHSQG